VSAIGLDIVSPIGKMSTDSDQAQMAADRAIDRVFQDGQLKRFAISGEPVVIGSLRSHLRYVREEESGYEGLS
jgi:hypothetical protein